MFNLREAGVDLPECQERRRQETLKLAKVDLAKVGLNQQNIDPMWKSS